jgi:hypothetical protein
VASFPFDPQAIADQKPARARRPAAHGRDCTRDACEGCSGDLADVPRDFQRIGDGAYRMRLAPLGVEFILDRTRRKFDELHGELTVLCSLAGARTFNGALSVADLNLSSQRARQERATYLAGRARGDLDWLGLLEEFVSRVLAAERTGQPAVLLRDVPRPRPDDVLYADGLPLLARHPMILFGDGGAAKSYLALRAAGLLDQQGIRVGLFDWELAGEDHRERLEMLFPGNLPGIVYARCEKPLIHEIDRLRRIVRDERLGYVILDSIAFACDGPPEAAEVAGKYFRATRQLGEVGSLHVAHVSKAEGADQKPFGSAFWHNGARSTWYVKRAEGQPDSRQINVGLFNRKNNVGGLRSALAYDITFSENDTVVRRAEVADNPDLASNLSVRQRMAVLLRGGEMSPKAIAEEISATVDTVTRTARRYRDQFTVLPGGNLGILERRS